MVAFIFSLTAGISGGIATTGTRRASWIMESEATLVGITASILDATASQGSIAKLNATIDAFSSNKAALFPQTWVIGRPVAGAFLCRIVAVLG